MKAIHILGLEVLTALSTFSRPAAAKQSANWAIDSETCYRRPFAPLEVQRALNIAKHVVNNLADGNYDATIQNFIQVLFNQDTDGVGLEWVQDVFAGEGPENLPGIANFDNKVDDDEVEAGDLIVYCGGESLWHTMPSEDDVMLPAIYEAASNTMFPGVLPLCGEHYEGPQEGDPRVSVPMVVTTAADGINRIYICSWMITDLLISTENLPGDYTVYPDSRNARELRARINNWPLGENRFGAGTGLTSFINRFLQFDIMFIEALTKTAAGGFRQNHLGFPLGWQDTIKLSMTGPGVAAIVKYNSGTYMFFALATFLYRSGFDIIADRSPQSGNFRGTLPWNPVADFGS